MFILPVYLLIGFTTILGFVLLTSIATSCARKIYEVFSKLKFQVYVFSEKVFFSKYKNKTHLYRLKNSLNLLENGHVPLSAYFILEGNASVFYKNKKIASIGPKSIIGAKEMISNKPTFYTITLGAGGQIGVVSKSQILNYCV